jgi:hypothetical protein
MDYKEEHNRDNVGGVGGFSKNKVIVFKKALRAMGRKNREEWKKAVKEELNLMQGLKVFKRIKPEALTKRTKVLA